MDWWALVREAFEVSRRGKTLWALASVSLLQSFILALLIGALAIPLALSAMAFVPAGITASDPWPSMPTTVFVLLDWIAGHRGLAMSAIVVLFFLWVASGVLDVAASAGSVAQTARLADNQPTSFSAGMMTGFSVWWRVVGILAIAAIPVLGAALIGSLGWFSLVTIPLRQGLAPDPLQLYVGTTVQSVINVIAGLVAVPLGVLAGLGMRTIVLRGVAWRDGWRDAVRLARSRLLDVVIVVLVLAASGTVVELALMTVIAVLVFAVGAMLLAVPLLGPTLTVLAGVLTVLVGAVAFLALTVWHSVVWTLFWRRVHTVDPALASLASGSGSVPAALSTRDA